MECPIFIHQPLKICHKYPPVRITPSFLNAPIMEDEMATHSSTFAWKIPWTEEPSKVQSMGSQRVGHY